MTAKNIRNYNVFQLKRGTKSNLFKCNITQTYMILTTSITVHLTQTVQFPPKKYSIASEIVKKLNLKTQFTTCECPSHTEAITYWSVAVELVTFC